MGQGRIGNEIERLDGWIGRSGLGEHGRTIGFGIDGDARCFILPSACCALLFRHIRNHHVRIDVRFNAAWRVDAAGVNFKPALRRFIPRAADKSRAADVRHRQNRFPGGQAMGNFNNRALGISVQQQVAFGVHHHAAAHFVRPIVVMRNAAQRAFNTAQNDWHLFVGLAAAL